MSIWLQLRRLVDDPPPEFAFEISQGGIAYSRQTRTVQFGFRPLETGVLAISPLVDNVVRPDVLFQQVRALTPPDPKPRKRRTALILPDYCARIAVLDFDAFPSDAPEQLSLVRFRLKKSIPFDLESARISYHAQPGTGAKKYQVVVAAAALEIVARYEAAFRAAGFEPGYVSTSGIASLNLLEKDGVRVYAKLSGGVLTVSVIDGENLRLLRCVELAALAVGDVMDVLYPTFAYVEDELGGRPKYLLLCGFGGLAEDLQRESESSLGVEAKPLHSRFGVPDETNTGLYGYLESLGGVVS